MLVGLIDGVGSFQVNHWRNKVFQFRIVIKLKNTADNIQLLTNIRDRLGVGKVYVNTTAVLFKIDDQQQIASILHIFATYPLLTTNMRSRFAFFKFCFMMRAQLTYTDYLCLKQNFDLIPPVFSEATAILNLPYFRAWLVGFTTAEGCFSIRNSGAHSFSISQAFDVILITAIKMFFVIPNIVRFITIKSEKPFYLVETYNRASLLRIIDFFESAPIKLGGVKLVQFNHFKQVVLSRRGCETT
jgi:LAGLIDADG endonuclease